MAKQFPITAENVKDASEETGLQLIRYEWRAINDTGPCACAIGCILAQKNGTCFLGEFAARWDDCCDEAEYEEMWREVAGSIGISPMEAKGFVEGFDRMSSSDKYCHDHEYMDGYQAGLAIYQELLHAGGRHGA